jgi:hypothetical protein
MSNLTVGSLSGLSANNFVIDVASGSKIVQPGAVLQVVSTTKTDTFTTSTPGFQDITGLSVSITPSSASSKFLVLMDCNPHTDAGATAQNATLRLMRDSTPIAIGDAAGSRERTTTRTGQTGGNNQTSQTLSANHLDSPATTSAITYKVQIYSTGSAVFVNRAATDTDNVAFQRMVSSITVMEIAG